ncbi:MULTISPECIES: hypothetical protein [Aneurinibacillus]|uniref:Uncharacterized protein n=1 Tax=Aneurinibacillus danicus TaxID=267746 RepID=A0A511V9P7_9BACL|nr:MULTISPECIES: hypothetical protein [Aneurinibacillus]GEN35529.1 hypothetical protein ADA01nite_29890 [Aneurinibacillus danicus]
MKKLLATVTILGTSLFTFGAGSASAANCPFTTGFQNLTSDAVTQQPNFADRGQLGNLFQKFMGNHTDNTQNAPAQQFNIPTQQLSNLAGQQSNCPFK